MKTRRQRPAMRLASLPVALAAIMAAQTATAQDTPAAGEGEATTLDRIEVTGSRIRKAEIETAQPILTLSREDIQKQGFNSVFDILQNLTSSGTPAISRADALAGGESVGGYYIDLRNLGPNRVLILLNGKRLGVDTSGLQDLGQIPFSAIQRIEVLKDGASSIYGSDAITGVVKVITRSNFEGSEANAYFGNYGEGDGTRQSYDFTIGATGERVGVTFSAEYSKEDPVWARNRWFSEVSIPYDGYPFDGWSLVSQNGVWLFGQCDPDPVQGLPLCTLDRGSDPRDPDNYHAMDFPERANPNEQMMLQTGIERRSLFTSATLDLTDAIRFRSDIGYTNRITDQQVAGQPGQLVVSADSYFNPTPGEDILVLRRQWEMPRRNRSELDALRVSLGLEGALDVVGRPWDWTVNYTTNENKINKSGTGEGSLAAIDAAVGASWFNPDTGRVECGSADDPVPYGSNAANGECAPYNPLLPFGEPGQGSLGDPVLQAFLFPEKHDIGRTKTAIWAANLAGTLFTLPAGDLGIAAGVEHRSENGRFVPDALTSSGGTQGNAASATEGRYTVKEAYVEFDIPLLADLPGARELGLNLATRYSDYSSFGDTTNSKFSMRWRPMEGLLVRATYAEGFRAPTIGDLYGGINASFEFYTDPCAVGQPGAGGVACTAAGVPADFIQRGQAGAPCAALPCQTDTPFLTGSNPDLSPETAKSRTIGIVWSPRWLEGLDLTLDWYDIEMTNLIAQDAVDSILRDCYISNVASRCQGVVRDPVTHVITDLFFGLTNLGGARTEGYDFTVNYRLPELSVGRFAVNWQSSYVSKFDVLADNNPDTLWTGIVGRAAGDGVQAFRLRSNLGLTWEKGDYALSYMARYYSGIREACAPDLPPELNPLNYPPHPCDDPDHVDVAGDPEPLRRVGSNTFHDLQFSVKLPWNATASLGANNITEHYGPVMFSTPNSEYAYFGGFDIGRFWYLRYQQRF